MNNVTLVGRLTKDPEVKTTQTDKSTCTFSIAVDRPTKEKTADFINCVAWEKNAELIGKYLTKGSRIGIIGAIQSRSWEGTDGKRIYVTEVLVNRIEFIDTKKDRAAKKTGEDIEMDDDVVAPFDI